jgi:uncharacterized tellurite resistance protein B-like protein
MTNQEIYNELGKEGTLLILFVQMAASDQKLDQSELEAIRQVMSKFTDKDFSTLLKKVLEIGKKLTPEKRIDYILAGLDLFALEFDKKSKDAVIEGLKSIAFADGIIHEAEGTLYSSVVNIFKQKSMGRKNLSEFGFSGDMLVDLLHMAGIWPSELDLSTIPTDYALPDSITKSARSLINNVKINDSVWYEIACFENEEFGSFGIVASEGDYIESNEFVSLIGIDDYPWNKRGPLWYSSDLTINQNYFGPILFLRDGLVSVDPRTPGNYILMGWERWKKYARPEAHKIFLGNDNVEVVIEAKNPNAFTKYSFDFALSILDKVISAAQKSLDKSYMEHPAIIQWEKKHVMKLSEIA